LPSGAEEELQFLVFSKTAYYQPCFAAVVLDLGIFVAGAMIYFWCDVLSHPSKTTAMCFIFPR